MVKVKKIKFSVILFALAVLMAGQIEPVLAGYDRANIISDSVFLNKSTLSAGAIRDFMRSKGSGYTDYIIPEYITVAYPVSQGTWGYVSVRQYNDTTNTALYGKLVSDLIYDEAQEHGINPQLTLVTIQKESSGVTENIIGQARDHWAMGYAYLDSVDACFDRGENCNPDANRQRAIDYGGVGQQIAYATAQFQRLYGRYAGGSLTTTIDGTTITCANVATRVLYAYTPHFSGNKNFYNIFSSWFGDPTQVFTYNDTSPVSGRTYNDRTELKGSKASDTEVSVGGQVIASPGATSWSYSRSLGVGTNSFDIVYKVGGSIVATKSVRIIRQKTADINGDGGVNLLDLSILANNYGQESPADPMANLNPTADNGVDLLDISIFANSWEG